MTFFKKAIIFSVLSLSMVVQAENVRIAWLSPMTPDYGGVSPFWPFSYRFMQAAAEDLGISLEVYNFSRSPVLMEKFAAQIASGEDGHFDAVMFYDIRRSGVRSGRILNEAGINFFTFNINFMDRYPEMGRPRQLMKHWLGAMYPDDVYAGELLTSSLVAEFERLHPGKSTSIVGFYGKQMSPAGEDRALGLDKVIKRLNNHTFNQYITGIFSREVVKTKVSTVRKRYPEARILWAVNDGAALGLHDGLVENGDSPGEDFIIGGVDWVVDAIELIQKGKMNVSVGGHFLEGAFALVLLHDYAKGKDFNELGTSVFPTKMDVLTSKNVARIGDWRKKVSLENIKTKIDFKAFSRVHNPDMKAYDFSIDRVIDEL